MTSPLRSPLSARDRYHAAELEQRGDYMYEEKHANVGPCRHQCTCSVHQDPDGQYLNWIAEVSNAHGDSGPYCDADLCSGFSKVNSAVWHSMTAATAAPNSTSGGAYCNSRGVVVIEDAKEFCYGAGFVAGESFNRPISARRDYDCRFERRFGHQLMTDARHENMWLVGGLSFGAFMCPSCTYRSRNGAYESSVEEMIKDGFCYQLENLISEPLNNAVQKDCWGGRGVSHTCAWYVTPACLCATALSPPVNSQHHRLCRRIHTSEHALLVQ